MIGVIAHVEKAGAAEALGSVIAALRSRQVPFLVETKTALLAGLPTGLETPALAEKCDLLLVMGGDGTILRVIHHITENIPPIFGLNIGSLGFLTCLGAKEIDAATDCIVAKNYVLSPRCLLRTTLIQNEERCHFDALNEVVVSRGERSQLVKVRVLIDRVVLTDYYADGLIVATPTGSTAYSLSSGGPILMPDSGSLVVTPICPHVLTNRSVVVGDNSVIELQPKDAQQEVFLTVDGHATRRICGGERLEIRKSSRILPLAMLPGQSFSEVLRQKLKWSGSNI